MTVAAVGALLRARQEADPAGLRIGMGHQTHHAGLRHDAARRTDRRHAGPRWMDGGRAG